MICEEYRDRLVDALANGESSLAGDVVVHLRGCAECREFHAAQVHLFRALDSGVRLMVNETVPASLLPRVRARVAEAEMPRRMWGVGWGFAAVVAAAVLVIAISFLKRSPESVSKLSGGPPVVESGVHGVTRATPAQSQGSAVGLKSKATRRKAGRVPEENANGPEVIVLAEERAAFVRFVTDLPEEKDVALALTRPAAGEKADAVEIALLQIDELDVKPLASSNR